MSRYKYYQESFLVGDIERPIERLYIHTVAVRGITFILNHARYHRVEKHFDGFGYHAYAKKAGPIQPGRDPEVPGAGVFGDNRHTLHTAVEGHGDYEPWTEAQERAIVSHLADYLFRCHTKDGRLLADVFLQNPSRVLGHREVSWLVKVMGWLDIFKTTKTCPGNLIDMSRVRRYVLVEVKRRKELT